MDTIQLIGEGGVKWTFDLPLTEILAAKVTRGELRPVDEPPAPPQEKVVDNDETTETPAESGKLPNVRANKAEWVGAAVAAGMSVDDADAATKQDLIELLTKGGEDGDL